MLEMVEHSHDAVGIHHTRSFPFGRRRMKIGLRFPDAALVDQE